MKLYSLAGEAQVGRGKPWAIICEWAAGATLPRQNLDFGNVGMLACGGGLDRGRGVVGG